jgi:hypothetical protein
MRRNRAALRGKPLPDVMECQIKASAHNNENIREKQQ